MKHEIKKAIAALVTPENVEAYRAEVDRWIFADSILIDADLDLRDEDGGLTEGHEKRVDYLDALLDEALYTTGNAKDPNALEVTIAVTRRDGKHDLPVHVLKVGELTSIASLLVKDPNVVSFRIGNMIGNYPGSETGDLTAFITELNSISRFGKNANVTATR